MSSSNQQSGAVLVEIAILFPLFFFGVLFFIWISTVFNAKSAMTNAVARAVRLAITRSDPNLVGGHTIEDLEVFISSRVQSDRFKILLSNNVDWQNAEDNYEDFNAGDKLSDLPPEYLYSLVYVYQYLRQSLSGELRYPCDPALPTEEDPPAGAGCIKCSFAGNGTSEFGLDCSYQPSHILLTPMVNLLRMVSGEALMPQILITRRLVFDVSGS